MRPIPFVVGQSGAAHAQQQQSMVDTLSNGVDFAYQTHVDALGWVDDFSAANTKSTMIRVGATGTTPPSQTTWTAANTQISHNLGRQPIGWVVVFKDKVCDIIVGTTPADTQFAYLTINDDTANVTLMFI